MPVEEVAKGYALLNAVEHGGRAAPGPVMGKLMAECPELRSSAREVARIVAAVVEEVNRLGREEQEKLLAERYSWVLERKKQRAEEERGLPPLPGAREGAVVTRFAPNPDFVIHLGNARPAVLSHEYSRLYKGKFILRFEDTDPRTKPPLPEAYDLIREDLRWLGLRWDEEYIQSLRLEKYYEVARRLLERGCAYVDDRPGEEFRSYRNSGRLDKYPPRLRSPEENLELWDRMLEGAFAEGEAVVRVKTDPRHPDPSIRDWVALRLIDTAKHPHPLVGDRYVVWPTYNLAAGVDDHYMGMTHILRAKEHMQNTEKQKYVYKCLGWSYPHVIHFGRLKLEDAVMSKSAIKRIYEAGTAYGVDDPRFATIAGLRRRGFTAEAIRELILRVGVKYTDASISMANLAAINRSIVDTKAPRVMAAAPPLRMRIEGLPAGRHQYRIPFHPSAPLGERVLSLEGPTAEVYVSATDARLLKPGRLVRLMEAFNVEVVEVGSGVVRARYHSSSLEEARKRSAPIIQWVPAGESAPLLLLKPHGMTLETVEGVVEQAALKLARGSIVQLVRIGFARIDAIEETPEGLRPVLIYSHQ